MVEQFISYFSKKHFLTNFLVIGVFIGSIFAWQNTKKEELPDITFNTVRISVSYPGAPAEDVEYFVTKPIEEEIKGVDGVYRITSTSSVSISSITVEIEQDYPDIDEVLTEIRNAVFDVKFPDEVRDDPEVRLFKTSKKAILDIAIINKEVHLLDVEHRRNLQKYAFALENQLLNLSEVNSINKNGYLQQEIQIKAYPDKLLKYEIPFNAVMSEIQGNHIRKPAGTIETKKEPKVTLAAELNTVDKLNDLIVQGGFDGQVIRLSQVADVQEDFKKDKSITKINGHQGIMFSVVKNSSFGILDSLTAVEKVVEGFRANNLVDTPYEVILLDDESIDLRNRLSIISINGAYGFVLIVLTLFIFLNKRSGLWVAMGIPFTFCFTMIVASFLGYTINGMTLAAVIIVMGMVVDDAIVVAENITRLMYKGMDQESAVIKGTSYVLLPVIASIVTTCIAFIPLFFFTGRFGLFVKHLPPIIFIMLGASLFESIFVLPGHMSLKSKVKNGKESEFLKKHWFDAVEDHYGRLLEKILPFKWFVLGGFVCLLIFSGFIVSLKMKFVLFPNEETRDINISGTVDPDFDRFETANVTRQVENVLGQYLKKESVGFVTEIARSSRGGAVEENKFRMTFEIVPKEKRKKSADQIINELKEKTTNIENLDEIVFTKSRWGQSSGRPIELIVQENNDKLRLVISQLLVDKMKQNPALENIEIDMPLVIDEYKVDINREKAKRLSIDPKDIASTFRAALEGTVLYEFSDGDEDVDVRFTIVDESKDDIEKVLGLPVENKGNYLVPLRDVVYVEKVKTANSISRRDLKRTTIIDAGIKKGIKQTPLEIAEYLESKVFPEILSKYPTTTLSFSGEVLDTRESQSDIKNAIIMVIVLIYFVLVVLFNSLTKPIIIMLSIPFGVVGIILAFWLHGKVLFGFYAAIGALGLAGVVINDSIIMLVKLDKEYGNDVLKKDINSEIASIAKTRLRAVVLTTVTTIAGLIPTAYGFAGYDAMLAEMMLALTWGLAFGTFITLLLIPCVYSVTKKLF